MAGNWDISMLGDEQLQKKLHRLTTTGQRRVVSSAIRKAGKRVHASVLQKLQGNPVKIRTGKLLAGMRQMRPIAGPTKRGRIRWDIPMPYRELLEIDPGDKHYYPAAVEYGLDNVPPHSYIRSTIDEDRAQEFAQIGRDIGVGIIREAKKG